MKLINIINNYSEQGTAPRYYLKADTALLRNNDAFYIPDGVGRVIAEPHIVLKVSRLAKYIGERFAARCIEGVMGGVAFTAIDKLDEARLESDLADKALEQAEENRRVSTEQYKLGLETLSDHLEAQTLWQQAWQTQVEAHFNQYLNGVAYRKANGTLRQ